MTDPIEAMAVALSMADPDDRGLPDGTDMAQFYRGLATAAYNALRETLVPVGWLYVSPEKTVRRVIAAQFDHGRPDYWTETPLFALPEIKP